MATGTNITIFDRETESTDIGGKLTELISLGNGDINLIGDSPTEGDTDIVDDIFFLNDEGVDITERLVDTKKIKNVTDIGVVDSDCDTALEIRVGILDVEECSTPTEDFVKPNLFDGLYYNRTYLNGNKYYDIPAISSECCSKLEGTYDGKAESFLSEEGYTKCRYRDEITCDSFNGSTLKKWGNRVPYFEINNEETPFVPSVECCDNIQWEYNGKKYDLTANTSSIGKISCRIPDECFTYVANNIANNEAEKYNDEGYYIFSRVRASLTISTPTYPTLDDLKVPSAECCNNVQGLTSKIVNGRIFCVKEEIIPDDDDDDDEVDECSFNNNNLNQFVKRISGGQYKINEKNGAQIRVSPTRNEYEFYTKNRTEKSNENMFSLYNTSSNENDNGELYPSTIESINPDYILFKAPESGIYTISTSSNLYSNPNHVTDLKQGVTTPDGTTPITHMSRVTIQENGVFGDMNDAYALFKIVHLSEEYGEEYELVREELPIYNLDSSDDSKDGTLHYIRPDSWDTQEMQIPMEAGDIIIAYNSIVTNNDGDDEIRLEFGGNFPLLYFYKLGCNFPGTSLP